MLKAPRSATVVPHDALLKLLVKHEFSQARYSGTLQAGDQVPKFLHGLDLFLKEFTLQHIGQVGIIVLASNGMKVQQALRM